MEVFDGLDVDESGELSIPEVMRLVGSGEGVADAKMREGLPLFFRHLDSGAGGAGGAGANDSRITRREWQSGFLGSLSHYTDREVVALCDGMLAHVAQHQLSTQMLGIPTQGTPQGTSSTP